MELNTPPLKRRVCEVLRDHVQLLAERWGIGVEVHKHKPLPEFAGCFLQRMRYLTDMGEVPVARHIFQGAVEVPQLAVGGTVKRLPASRAFLTQRPRTAVSTALDKSFDLAFRHSGNDNGVGADVVDVMVTDFRDVLLLARPLPDTRPHSAHFLPEEIGAGVAAGGQIGISSKFISLGGTRCR